MTKVRRHRFTVSTEELFACRNEKYGTESRQFRYVIFDAFDWLTFLEKEKLKAQWASPKKLESIRNDRGACFEPINPPKLGNYFYKTYWIFLIGHQITSVCEKQLKCEIINEAYARHFRENSKQSKYDFASMKCPND